MKMRQKNSEVNVECFSLDNMGKFLEFVNNNSLSLSLTVEDNYDGDNTVLGLGDYVMISDEGTLLSFCEDDLMANYDIVREAAPTTRKAKK